MAIPEALKGINRLEATAAQGPKLPDEIPGARETERAQTQLQELQQRADAMGLCVPWMTYSTLSLWQTLDALTVQKTICIEDGELDTQDYDITDDWLEALHVDYAKEDIASPTSTVFMRWVLPTSTHWDPRTRLDGELLGAILLLHDCRVRRV